MIKNNHSSNSCGILKKRTATFKIMILTVVLLTYAGFNNKARACVKPTVITVPQTACAPVTTINLTLPGVTAGSTSGLTFTYYTDPSATISYPTPTAATAGTYYIVGVITGGCSDTTAVIFTVNPKPTVITVPQTACTPVTTINLTLAAVTAGSTGGLAFTYFTDAGATVSYPTPTVATSGTYYIVGTTSGLCSDTTAVTATVNLSPTVTNVASKTISSSTNTNITLTASAASTFSWTIGTITGGITGASNSAGATINQTLTNPSNTIDGTVQYLVTPTSTTSLCVGQAFTITVTVTHVTNGTITIPTLSVTGCSFPTAYSTLGNIVITEGANGDISTFGTLILTAPANFEFLAGSGTFNFTVAKDITSISSTSVTANNITLTINGTTFTNLDVITISGIQVRGITGAAGPQNVTRTAGTSVIAGDANGAVHATFTSFLNSVTGGTVATAQTICGGGNPAAFTESIASTGSGTLTYQWKQSTDGYITTLATTLTYDVPAGLAVTTTYRRITTSTLNAIPCTSISNDIIVTVNPKPIVITNNPTTVCSPTTVNLTLPAVTLGSTGGLTYTYFIDAAATVPYTTPTVATTGTYYIVGITLAGCSDTTAVSVTVNPMPTVITVPQSACAPVTTIDLTLQGVTVGSTPGLTYSYFIDAGATIPYCTPTTATVGTYYIVGVISGGCSDTTAVTITGQTQFLVTQYITAATCGLCDGGLSVAPSGGTAPYTVLWSTGSALDTLTSLCSGFYSVQITDAVGCSQNIVMPLNSQNAPTLTISSTAMTCNGSCNGTASVVASGGITPYSYLWNDPGTQTSNIATALCAGKYYAQVVGGGCVSFASVVITDPSPTLSSCLTPPAICSGSVFSYSPTSTTVGAIFTWTRASVTGISNLSGSGTGNPNETLTNTTGSPVNVIYLYSVTANGCTNSTTYSVIVTVTTCVGIQEVNNASGITVFPNPSSGQFTFDGLKDSNLIEVFDITGRFINSETIQSRTYTIDLGTKDKGLYFYRITDNKKRIQQGKLIIQ